MLNAQPVWSASRVPLAVAEIGKSMAAAKPSTARPTGAPGNKELVALMRAVAGQRDKGAFADLFSHFAPRVKSFVMRAGTSPDVAEELAQETLLMVWRKAESFDPAKAAVSTWVFTIARNKRIDRLRRERQPEIDPEDLKLESNAPDPAASLSAAQNQDILEGAMSELSDDQARVVRMAFYEDKSHSAIAEELGLPLGTVKSRIRLALSRLRGIVESEDL